MAEVIAKEALALGVNQLFAPVSDLARELRFGRVRTYGLEEQGSIKLTKGHRWKRPTARILISQEKCPIATLRVYKLTMSLRW
jgi:hypothetical protein